MSIKIWYGYQDDNGEAHGTSDNKKAIATWRDKPWKLETEVRKGIRVSTVFIPVSVSFGAPHQPKFFETVIFGGKRDGEYFRNVSKEQAMEQHEKVVCELSTDLGGR